MANKSLTNLEAEMKLLHWHKVANEASLKAAILKNRQVKRDEKGLLVKTSCAKRR
jgi:hypothetical protein